MKPALRLGLFSSVLLCLASSLVPAGVSAAPAVGVARIDVTPVEPILLTGYAMRQKPHVGVEQRLWAKALAIGSDREDPAVLLTLDNCGITEETWRDIRRRIEKSAKLKSGRLVIAVSHTHSAPATKNWAPNIFVRDLTPDEQGAIDRYTADLVNKLERVALEALKNRRAGRLSWSQGSVGFAKNRRVLRGSTAVFGENAAAPVDHALPVLKAETADGGLLAVVANYACHCTTIGGVFNHTCGDWAGYAQEYIERDHPGATAFITIGCGADANPSPRGGADDGLALAKQHGETLAAEVKRMLGRNFSPLTGKFASKVKEIRLPFGPHYTRDQWETRAKSQGIVGYHARKWLARLDRGEKLPDSLYYPITTWNFGDNLAMVFLPGEVVVDYSLRLKRELDGQRLWVTAYANYVPCYIPSRRILAEGGYEAEDSLWYYDRPARLSTNAEELIVRTVHGLVPKSFRIDPRKSERPDPKTPGQALGTFRAPAGLSIELVASEPLVQSPVAIDWDSQGRLWVCEMYDYPSGLNPPADLNRKYGEPLKVPPGGFTPGGRIKILTDPDGDGHYDKATVFLDRISFPTGVMPWRKGALICAAPDILYAEDTNGDGRADLIRTNITGFPTHNFQARVNGFRWGLDGWLHGSSGLFGGKVKSLQTGREVDLSGRDFRYRPDTGEIEPVAGISQFGRVRDDFDHWFGNDNSTLLWHYPLPDHYLRRNSHVTYPEPRLNVAADVRRRTDQTGNRLLASAATNPNQLFPASRTLERFNDPHMANIVTSACGPDLYRDQLLGPEYQGNAFICEPVHNLVRRLVLEPDGVTFAGRRAAGEERGEFLASTDNWFRPVQVRTGPDGALYIVDMYRFVIEHPRWIPPERLAKLDIRAGADLGRIYRIVPKGSQPRPVPVVAKLSGEQLVEAINSPNGPLRDLAQQDLLARGLQTVVMPAAGRESSRPDRRPLLEPLRKLAGESANPAVRLQALSSLALAKALTPESLSPALEDADANVRRFALRLSEPMLDSPALAAPLRKLAADASPMVRLQLALSLGGSDRPEAMETLASLSQSDDRWLRAAVLSSSTRHAGALLREKLKANSTATKDTEFISRLVATAVGVGSASELASAIQALAPATDVFADAEAGAKLEPWRLEAIAALLDGLKRLGGDLNSARAKLDAGGQAGLGRIDSVLKRACKLAAEPAADESLRRSAIRLLGTWDHELGDEVLFDGVLRSASPPSLQSAAVDALARSRRGSVGERVVREWNHFSPGVRGRVLDALLNRAEWTGGLVGALERGDIRGSEVSATQRQRLLALKDPGLRERVAGIFSSGTSGGRAEIVARYRDVARLAGRVEQGSLVFDRHCAQCHALRGRGHEVGPNLAEFAGKSIGDFVLAIFDPNAGINPNFVAYNVEMKDGRSLSGIVRNETASGLALLQGGGVRETILRSDIASIRAASVSLMPEGLEQAMTPQDVADLVAWIKGASPAVFGSASAAQAAQARAEFLKEGLNGLAEVTSSAEILPYPSWLGRQPMAYCRQNTGQSRLAWRTRPVPALSAGKFTFRLPAAMGFASQPAGKFQLKLNGKPALDFDVTLADRSWESADGKVRMSYLVKEANSEDGAGVLLIETDASLLTAGKAAEFEVIGSPANSQRWFGIYVIENVATARH